MHPAVFGDHAVTPDDPLLVLQQRTDRLALIVVGAPKPVAGIGGAGVQQRVAPGAPAMRCILQIKPFKSVETIRGHSTRCCG